MYETAVIHRMLANESWINSNPLNVLNDRIARMVLTEVIEGLRRQEIVFWIEWN